MLRLVVLGAHTRILSSVCADCPHSPAGCCQAPPKMDWSDAGRLTMLGQGAWLLSEIAAGRLAPSEGGLVLKKAKGVARAEGPKLAKCVYHAADRGCTIDHDQRPATCNYYVCASVYEADRAEAERAEAARAALAEAYAAWDAELAARIASQWPEGPPWDAAFVAWLGEAFRELAARDEARLPGG